MDEFSEAVTHLERRYAQDMARLADDNVEVQLHTWLDAGDRPLACSDPVHVTADEWFFVTTLYGEMTLDGQRSHIRRFFEPLFVRAAQRDVRNFRQGMREYAGLRYSWMAQRLSKMGALLRSRGLSMQAYVDWLRGLEQQATPRSPMPALDAIVRDLQVTGWKTLSVFVRDCVGGKSFPIDSRVSKELTRWNLPADERWLVSQSLRINRNPRQTARLFYEAGGN